MTLVRRLGNKSKLLPKLLPLFPAHKIYIEPFFGSGSVFFAKPRAKYSFLNDKDSELFNCFQVLMKQREELRKYIEMIPYGTDFWNYAKKSTPENDLERAVFFLVLSNWGYMGQDSTIRIEDNNSKRQLLLKIEETYLSLVNDTNTQFTNLDFRELYNSITARQRIDEINSFSYLDPPYLDTGDNYQRSFTEQDSNDLLDTVTDFGGKFAMSEFAHPFILEQAKQRGLNVHILGERQNLKNRNTEILVTNYTLNYLF